MRRFLDEHNNDHVNSSFTILRGMVRLKLSIRPCFVFSVGWSTNGQKDGLIFSFLSYRHMVPRKHSNLSHALSLVYGTEVVVPIEVIVSSTRLVLASTLSDPHERYMWMSLER